MLKKKKPDWLKIVERQSWEAELLVSGLTVYGSFKVLPVADKLVDKLVIHFSDEVLNMMEYAMLYYLSTFRIIIVGVLVHFVLRVLWIAVVGLNSVFPKGINIYNGSFSNNFLKKIKSEFPNSTEYSLELDKVCSVIFSILCSTLLMMASLFFWILIIIFLLSFIGKYVGEESLGIIKIVLIVLLYVFVIILYLTTTGRYKDSNLARKYSYPVSSFMNKAFGLFMYEPLNYILYIIRTNITTGKFIFGTSLILFTGLLLASPKISEMKQFYSSDDYFRMCNSPLQIEEKTYLDKINGDFILRPVIQSEVIDEDYLSLFIPSFYREKRFKSQLCGEFVKDTLQHRTEQRSSRRVFDLQCINKYYNIYIDDNKVDNLHYSFKTQEPNGEEGVQTYIRLDSINNGPHVLKIESHYLNKKAEKAIRYIPFYKTKD